MTTHTLKRADEPAFVVAAKNMADRFTAMGGKRSQFLEAEAKRRGFADWNTWRARGEVSLSLSAPTGLCTILKPGIVTAESDVFLDAARTVLAAAADAGYECDFSAPVVISSDLDSFSAMSRASRGLVLRRSFTPRTFVHIEGLGGNAAAELAASLLAGRDGIIIFDMPGTSGEALDALAASCPKAVILSHVRAGEPDSEEHFLRYSESSLGWGSQQKFAIPLFSRVPAPPRHDDMWGGRMLSMLTAFSRSGQVFDSRARPELIDLDISHPEMLAFCLTIPGFDPVMQRGRHQSDKAVEQFRFIAMHA